MSEHLAAPETSVPQPTGGGSPGTSIVSRVLPVVPAGGASLIVAGVTAARPLTALPRGLAIGCVIASWISVVVFSRREVRSHASVIAAIAAVVAAGQTDAGPIYGVACGAFLIGCLGAMRATRRRGQPSVRPPRRVLAILSVVAAIVTGGLVVGLPWLASRLEQRINAMFAEGAVETTAFSTNMVLGATRGMTKSNTIVMRIDGERPEYLRGAVYDVYHQRYWGTSGVGTARATRDLGPVSSGATTTITLTRAAPNGDDMRWFLPPNACDVQTPSGRVETDGFGITRRPRSREERQAVRFRTKGCDAPPAAIAPPSPNDLDVPSGVAERLRTIAVAWTAGAATDREKLDAIERQLLGYSYSLSVARDDRLDPIVDFLTVHRAGHCELFASALALLARTQGIPTRLVGGYRVSEVNPITRSAVVRDRNAHAWVEAWVDGSWREWDPTPASEAFAPPGTAFEHLGDLLSAANDRMLMTIARLGPLGLAGSVAALMALLVGTRALLGHVADRRRRRPRGGASGEPPPRAFVALIDALASAGHPHEASEPLEAFARRLARVDAPWGAHVQSVLLRYAGLRYGGVGDEASVIRDVAHVAEAVRAHRRA